MGPSNHDVQSPISRIKHLKYFALPEFCLSPAGYCRTGLEMSCFLTASSDLAFNDVIDNYAKALDYVIANSKNATKKALAIVLRAKKNWTGVSLQAHVLLP